MPHTAAEPSQLAVVALFAKKEKEEICLCARSRREIYVSLPPPSGIKPPSGYEFISPFKIPLLLQTLMPIEPRLLPSFPKHFFSLGNGRKRRSPWEFGKIV